MKPTDILSSNQRDPSKAYLTNGLRIAVENWRYKGYPGISGTSKRLLEFWFEEDHLVNYEPFNFWFAQREAIETLIYLYEVLKQRSLFEMAKEFGKGVIPSGYDPSLDQYPLYCYKMATGSGKTFVMALTIIWSYFNSKKENKDEFTSKFLLIAPNIIVYERLKKDFQNGDIFHNYPFIPSEWENEFDLNVILRKEPIHTLPENVLFLTNIQQLEDRQNKELDETDEYVDNILEITGDVDRQDIYEEDKIKQVLETCPNIMVLKDEAHHIYSLEKSWKRLLTDLNQKLEKKYGKGINSEFDFSATPKSVNGVLFPWIIVDFTLKEAIEMNIVKRPLKGEINGVVEIPSEDPVERYKTWIDAGVNRWRKYKENLKIFDKNPILFVMCEKTSAANKVYDYLNMEPDLNGKILLIHTNLDGEIYKKDLEDAREASRKVDDPNSPYEAIISVMMLNEGWDVRNVNIIVGLRSYNSKRKVLPEQVIGRGLRKMFPLEEVDVDTGINTLEVIGPPGLIQILDELEDSEGIQFDPIRPEIQITAIYIDKNKMDKDINLPILSPRIVMRDFAVDSTDINLIPALNLQLQDKILESQVEYIAKDMLNDVEVVREMWDLPVPKNSKLIVNYYTFQIQKFLGMGQVFSQLYPIVKKYVEEKLFNQRIDLEDPRVVRMLGLPELGNKLVNIFVKTFKERGFVEKDPRIMDYLKVSTTRPFPWAKLIYPADKCIFNYAACDSQLEVNFCKFLDNATDVVKFCKLPLKTGFFVEYKDSEDRLRHYFPDFVVIDNENNNYIIETKGLEDVNVRYKDKRMIKWCKDVSELTGAKWEFIKVMQDDFYNTSCKTLNELQFWIQTEIDDF